MSSSWPREARSRHATVDGQELHYLDFDGPRSSPLVVCVHGLGGSALNFGAFGPLLTHRHRMLALDLPGHGRSEAGTASSRTGDTVDGLVRLVERFLLQVAESPVILIGHSLGGVLTVLLAQRSPATVSSLALLAPPVPHQTRLPRDVRLMMKLALLRTPGVRQIVDRQLARSSPAELVQKQLADATPHVSRVPPEAVDASVIETADRLASAGAAAARRLQWNAILDTIALLGRSAAWTAHLATVGQATIWMHGHDDRLVPIDDARALAAARPGWTFRSRPGIGHLPHLEDPSWVSHTLIEWLAGADDGSHD